MALAIRVARAKSSQTVAHAGRACPLRGRAADGLVAGADYPPKRRHVITDAAQSAAIL
jgi:hypothetical protein